MGEEAHPSFKDAKTERLVITESYGEVKKVSLKTDITNITSKLLKHAGINVVTESAVADFTEVRGETLGGPYIGNISGWQYSSAQLWICTSLRDKNGYVIKEKAENKQSPPSTIYSMYPTPDDAPFAEVLKSPHYRNY